MKHGKTLVELAEEVNRQAQTKRDFVLNSQVLKMTPKHEGWSETLTFEGGGLAEAFQLTENAHEQLGEYCGIPRKYYDAMRKEPNGLLAANVNHWLAKMPEKRMLRTLDGKVRAFLSEKYRPLDNYELLESVLPTLQQFEASVESCEVTENRLYLKVVTPKQLEVKVGEIVQSGLVISNSEIGRGGRRV